MKRKEKGRALFYSRDSGGRHEMTPGGYVEWARRKAAEYGLDFDGTAAKIDGMIRAGLAAEGDLYFDFGVQGNVLSRAGLDALSHRAKSDPTVSHILIPRRDRLARPDDPTDGIRLETRLRKLGLTIVFMDKVCEPIKRGQRRDIAETIGAVIEYDQSGKDRRDLAEKVIFAQLRLAKLGFSTGGRPPYGFRRWLVKEDGTPVRQLVDAEIVRMRGHHVVWLPGPDEEWTVIHRILELLDGMPASRVAQLLTLEGVPPPDYGRFRTDNRVRHRTSGVWHATTIVNIARNPLLLSVVEYGRRSMGDQLRATPEGPRNLDDADFRAAGAGQTKPKVIRNPDKNRITAPARFAAPVDAERHRRLLAKLDERGGTQRGKPRSRDPNKNPLGGRVFDMGCGWPMYRTPSGSSFRYKCGLYQQSHGAQCRHNHVDGLLAAQFLLGCVRQRALSPRFSQKLEDRIRALAAVDEQHCQAEAEISRQRATLRHLEMERDQAARNLARANSDEQYMAVSSVFDELAGQVKSLEAEIAAREQEMNAPGDVDSAVQIALTMVGQLDELARAGGSLEAARKLFDLVNARLFLDFEPVKVKKRTLNKLQGGVVTFGAAPSPINIYQGPTARNKMTNATASAAAADGRSSAPSPEAHVTSGEEGNSLGNVNRGDWT